jgi:hypothetical protein
VTRLRGERDGVGAEFLYRKLSPSQAAAIVKAVAAGVPRTVLAAEYGCSVRTIFRVLERAAYPALDVTVDGWHAEFVVAPEGPIRMTPWCARADA